VIKSEGHTLFIRVGDDDVRISASRVTRAPMPLAEIQPEGNSLDPTPRDISDSTPNETEEPEYVFDKIVGLRKADDGTWLYIVRWYGYSRDDKTWEPLTIPREVLCGDTTDEWDSRSETNSMLCLLANTRSNCFAKTRRLSTTHWVYSCEILVDSPGRKLVCVDKVKDPAPRRDVCGPESPWPRPRYAGTWRGAQRFESGLRQYPVLHAHS
jgi:hypothetical protein